MVTAEPRTQAFHAVESCRTLQGDPIADSLKKILPLHKASADRKRCGFDRLRLWTGRSTRCTVGGRCGYIGATRGGRQWRSRPRRSFGALLCVGAGAGAAATTKGIVLAAGPAAAMVVKKQGNYLEEDGGSGGIRSASPRLTLQLRGGDFYIRAGTCLKTRAQGPHGACKGSYCA